MNSQEQSVKNLISTSTATKVVTDCEGKKLNYKGKGGRKQGSNV